MKNKRPKYVVSSKKEFDYLEMAYKEFIENYELEFDGGRLLIEKGSDKGAIKIILQEIFGENKLIVKDKNLEKMVVATIFPYQEKYNVFEVKDKKYWLGHEALKERISTERYDPPRFFPRGDSGIKSGYIR